MINLNFLSNILKSVFCKAERARGVAKTLGDVVLSNNSIEEAGFDARLYAANRVRKFCRLECSGCFRGRILSDLTPNCVRLYSAYSGSCEGHVAWRHSLARWLHTVVVFKKRSSEVIGHSHKGVVVALHSSCYQPNMLQMTTKVRAEANDS